MKDSVWNFEQFDNIKDICFAHMSNCFSHILAKKTAKLIETEKPVKIPAFRKRLSGNITWHI